MRCAPSPSSSAISSASTSKSPRSSGGLSPNPGRFGITSVHDEPSERCLRHVCRAPTMLPWTRTTVGPLPTRSMSRSPAATGSGTHAEHPLRSSLLRRRTRRRALGSLFVVPTARSHSPRSAGSPKRDRRDQMSERGRWRVRCPGDRRPVVVRVAGPYGCDSDHRPVARPVGRPARSPPRSIAGCQRTSGALRGLARWSCGPHPRTYTVSASARPIGRFPHRLRVAKSSSRLR